MNLTNTHPPSPGTGRNMVGDVDVRSIINKLSSYRDLFHRIIDTEVVWRGEREGLRIIRANTEYILFDNSHMLIHNPSLDRVMTELHRYLADPTA